MTRTFTIRRAVQEDAPAIQALHRRAILGLEPGPYSREEIESWAAEQPLQHYADALSRGEEQFLVAADLSNRAVAFCSLVDDEIRGLYVDPDFARQGIARALLERAEAIMREAPVETVQVWASLTALAFYEAMGYAPIAKGELETRGGRTIEIVRMSKVLGPPTGF